MMARWEIDSDEATIYIDPELPPMRSIKVEVVMSGLWAGFYLGRGAARELAEALLAAIAETEGPPS
jgi:hypothetical protein